MMYIQSIELFIGIQHFRRFRFIYHFSSVLIYVFFCKMEYININKENK